MPISFLIRATKSTVSRRVLPPAPYVTETKVGASGASADTVSNSRASASGVLGGKNSNEKT